VPRFCEGDGDAFAAISNVLAVGESVCACSVVGAAARIHAVILPASAAGAPGAYAAANVE